MPDARRVDRHGVLAQSAGTCGRPHAGSRALRFRCVSARRSLLPTSIDARHTVGMADPLTDDDVDPATDPDDGLPVALAAVIARYRNRWFKVKLRGDVAADIARLAAIAPVLESARRISRDARRQRAVPGCRDARRIRCRAARREAAWPARRSAALHRAAVSALDRARHRRARIAGRGCR